MNTINENLSGVHTSLRKLELALQQEIAGGKNKREIDFKEAYPLIELHLSNKVPQKTVLEKFNAAYGYTLYPPRFRKMLEAERNRRQELGGFVTCATCGRQLDAIEDAAKSAEDDNGLGDEA